MYKRWMSLLLLSYLLLFFSSSAHAAEPNGSDAVGDDISFVMPLNTVRTIDHPSFTINGLTKGDFQWRRQAGLGRHGHQATHQRPGQWLCLSKPG